MKNSKENPEQLQADMARIRDELRDDVLEVVAGARELMNWRQFVGSRPWLAFGAAVIAGYLAVPKRVHLISPDADTLMKLAKKNQLIVKPGAMPEKPSGMLGPLVNLALATAVRQAANVMSQQIGRRMSATSHNGTQLAAEASASRSVLPTSKSTAFGDTNEQSTTLRSDDEQPNSRVPNRFA